MYSILIFIIIVGIGLYAYSWNRTRPKKGTIPEGKFPNKWRVILTTEVPFYRSLSRWEKKKFERKVQDFLLKCSISGVGTEITILEKILVASSAVIPIFGFKDWSYVHLEEVFIYPSVFNKDFEQEGPNRNVLGMVGTGYMDGKMILSQEALLHGFKNTSDKKNTAIHEFVHLIDKQDGAIDGIPDALIEKEHLKPWMHYMDKRMDEIFEGDSDINAYGGTNRAEFFSVTSEYFFERPKLLKKKHPRLYAFLEKIYKQDMTQRDLNTSVQSPSRNDTCPCGSGEKYKNCCGGLE